LCELPFAELFLGRTKRPLLLCLVDAHLCAALQGEPAVEAEAYAELQTRLEDTALEILDRATESSREMAYRILVRAAPRWEGRSALELAIDLDMNSFVVHRTVQLIVADEWWRGKYPHSPLALHPSAPRRLALLDAWLPLVRLATTTAVVTSGIGVATSSDESATNARRAPPPRLSNVQQMRHALHLLATTDRGASALVRIAEARLEAAAARVGGGTRAPKLRGKGGGSEVWGSNVSMTSRRQQQLLTLAELELLHASASIAPAAAATHRSLCAPPPAIERLLSRARAWRLLHVPLLAAKQTGRFHCGISR
jgi:hypothetical protein